MPTTARSTLAGAGTKKSQGAGAAMGPYSTPTAGIIDYFRAPNSS